jgi:hypothetical protein
MTYDGPEDRVSFAELLGYFRVGKHAAHRWVRSGELPSFKVGSARYSTVDQVVAFEIQRGRFNGKPAEREQLAHESTERLRNYLRARRGAAATGGLDDLVRRVERLEKLLGQGALAQEAAA